MNKQKILVLETSGVGLRSEVIGWDQVEDGNLVRMDKPVGLTSSAKERWNYPSPLHAIGDGWRLLGTPMKHKQVQQCDCPDKGDPKILITYSWWLEK